MIFVIFCPHPMQRSFAFFATFALLYAFFLFYRNEGDSDKENFNPPISPNESSSDQSGDDTESLTNAECTNIIISKNIADLKRKKRNPLSEIPTSHLQDQPLPKSLNSEGNIGTYLHIYPVACKSYTPRLFQSYT